MSRPRRPRQQLRWWRPPAVAPFSASRARYLRAKAGVTPALLACVLPLLAASCFRASSTIDWRGHYSLRPGTDDTFGPIPASERVHGKIHRNVDYVSFGLDAVLLRDLPNTQAGDVIALGIEVQGLLPERALVKTVSRQMHTCVASPCMAFFREPLSLRASRYPGRPVVLRVVARAIGADEAEGVRQRLAGASDRIKDLDPLNARDVAESRRIFDATIGSSQRAKSEWRYEVAWHPIAGTMERDRDDQRRENLLTEARHVIVLLPSVGSARNAAPPSPEGQVAWRSAAWSGEATVAVMTHRPISSSTSIATSAT